MRNLVWTFWLALILAIVGTFVTSIVLVRQWNTYTNFSQIEGRPNYPLRELSKEVEILLNNDGNLENVLLDNPIIEFGDTYLVNSLGIDVLDRTLPEEIMMNLDGQSISRQPIFSQTIKANSGELYKLIFRFDLRSRPLWNLFKRFGLYWVFFVAFVMSGVISWWLAIKIVRPIQDIAFASGLHDEEDFLSKIDEKILKRPDEIGELARQLQLSGMKIQELIKKQKDLLRDVSHEVRTPLARLQIATETLQLDAGDERALNQIKDEILIIDQLVQDLLHLSHFDRPSKSHQIENFKVNTLVDEFIERSKILASIKNLSITSSSTNTNNVDVKGNKFLLDRALDNLMSNAIRHSPNNSEIEIKTEIDNENCYVSISDQGEGVIEESLEKIFEPFYRLDTSRNRETGGFGLGLSLVKQIVELHKGSVNAFNHPNGLLVKLSIPLG
jgi:two-component system sensor histidine kinase CpxA